jgi:hypothetical protein
MLTAVKIGHCYGSHFKWIHMKFNWCSSELYMKQGILGYDVLADPNISQDPKLMAQARKR